MNTCSHKLQLLNNLHSQYRGCTGCHFNMPKATQIVLGAGNPEADLILIGEAPGKDEDLQGKPFVGRSGKLLDKIFDAIGISRTEIFITNIVKIRPPNNRRPFPTELAISRPILLDQISIIRPKVICTLGSAALEGLLGKAVKISLLRGKPISWNGIILNPTFHPAYILRNPKKLEILMRDIQRAVELSHQTP